ncbi:MAG: MurT ligase domain-containing protein [Bacilli bacterium]
MVKFIANTCVKFSRLLGNYGTSIGGKIAWTLDKNILKKLAKNVETIIVITGTNGKTTTSNLIASCFEEPLIHNGKGANMYFGVISAFLQGEGKVAVLEVDEGSVAKVFADLKVDYFVVTNFFRDQLDRYSEIDMLVDKIKSSISADTKLILNANDPFTMRLDNNNSIYYGISKDFKGFRDFEISESKYCPKCNSLLNYETSFYLQIGHYNCKCNFKTPKIDYLASSFKNSELVVNGITYKHNLVGNYNVFNLVAAFALGNILNLNVEAGFNKYYSNDGRMQIINEHIVTLAKNPSGMNLSLLQINPDYKNVLFTLNDNYVDGLDISWIWDADFEILDNSYTYYVNGLRKEDMALRLKYAGINPSNINIVDNIDVELDNIIKKPTFSISSYTAVDDIKKMFEKRVK